MVEISRLLFGGGRPASKTKTPLPGLGSPGGGSTAGPRLLKRALLAFALGAMGACDNGCSAPTAAKGYGQLEGVVTVEGAPRAGVPIGFSTNSEGILRPNEEVSTDGSGRYHKDLEKGLWQAAVLEIEGAVCPTPPAVQLEEEGVRTVNFPCELAKGTMAGFVTLNGNPEPELVVNILDENLTRVTGGTTDGSGFYSIDVPTGFHSPFVEIDGAECPAPTQTQVNVEHQQVHSMDLPCTQPSGIISGTVTLNGDPLSGLRVDILDGNRNVVAAPVTDGSGHYSAAVLTGLYYPEVRVDGAICPGFPFTEENVVASGDHQVDLPCLAIWGTYTGGYTETSNTCGVPLIPFFEMGIRVVYQKDAGNDVLDLFQGDRGEDTKVSGGFNKVTLGYEGETPPYDGGEGVTIQEVWEVLFGYTPSMAGPVKFSGIARIVATFAGGGSCYKLFNVEGIRVSN